jgi:hypothetical protein
MPKGKGYSHTVGKTKNGLIDMLKKTTNAAQRAKIYKQLGWAEDSTTKGPGTTPRNKMSTLKKKPTTVTRKKATAISVPKRQKSPDTPSRASIIASNSAKQAKLSAATKGSSKLMNKPTSKAKPVSKASARKSSKVAKKLAEGNYKAAARKTRKANKKK